MRWRKKRTTPTVTEVSRVEKVLEADRGVSHRLWPNTTPVSKRSGEVVYFSAETIAVGQALMARKLSPERAPVRLVLRAAVDVLAIGGKPSSGAAPPAT